MEADVKTFAAHGLHGLSVVAALTAQHTRGVTAVNGFYRTTGSAGVSKLAARTAGSVLGAPTRIDELGR